MKNLYFIIIAAVLLRLILSLTTYHSDMAVFDLAGKLVASGNLLNLYDFSSDSAVFNYPPAIYFFHGLVRFLFNGLFGSLFLKLPYLIFDLLTGYILWKLFDSPKKSLLALTLWMFNPVSLYATYMMGQFDIIPTFFTTLSIYLAGRRRLQWAALSLGFGIAFKIFPVFLIIPLVILARNYQERLKLGILALAPYLLSIIPFLPSDSFRATALFAGQSSKSLYANIPVSGGEAIILFPAFLLLFYLIIWVKKIRIDLWKMYAIALLLFFIFTHFHPQWLIWLTPFLIIDLVGDGFKKLIPVLLIFFSWFGSLFFFDPSLSIGMFAPLPGIFVLMNLNLDYNLSRSILQTIFASASLYLIYQHALRKSNV